MPRLLLKSVRPYIDLKREFCLEKLISDTAKSLFQWQFRFLVQFWLWIVWLDTYWLFGWCLPSLTHSSPLCLLYVFFNAFTMQVYIYNAFTHWFLTMKIKCIYTLTTHWSNDLIFIAECAYVISICLFYFHKLS
jgi:hypothetical protein